MASAMKTPLSLVVLALLPTTFDAQTFVETFDLAPSAPLALDSARWDLQIHSRDRSTFDALEGMHMGHGPSCQPPPATFWNTSYEGAAFYCSNHVMTGINAEGYGVIYMTPDHLVDFDQGEAVVRFEVSTLRTSGRDWWDLYLTPTDDVLSLPLEEWLPDLQGQPKNCVHVRMDLSSPTIFLASIWQDWQETELAGSFVGYESVITPDPRIRQTFELRISKTTLKFGLPDHGLWWHDTTIPELNFGRAVLQFGHHSYNPTKLDVAMPAGHDTSLAGVPERSPNTWHWDAIEITPARPFTMIGVDRRQVTEDDGTPMVTLDAPAPPDAFLRFAAIGQVSVSFDGGPFQPAVRRDGSLENAGQHAVEHFASYMTPIPFGTTTVSFAFQPDAWWTFEKLARDITVWSFDARGTGCPDAGGDVPRLATNGVTLGAPLDLVVTQGTPLTATIIALSTDELGGDGCELHLDPLALLMPGSLGSGLVVTDANGVASTSVGVPADPSLAGFEVYAQAFVFGGGALDLFGWSVSASPMVRLVAE